MELLKFSGRPQINNLCFTSSVEKKLSPHSPSLPSSGRHNSYCAILKWESQHSHELQRRIMFGKWRMGRGGVEVYWAPSVYRVHTHIILFKYDSNPRRQTLLCPLCTQGNWDSERLSNIFGQHSVSIYSASVKWESQGVNKPGSVWSQNLCPSQYVKERGTERRLERERCSHKWKLQLRW